MRTKDVVAFIKAREAARTAKLNGKTFMSDQIIQTYRFCNMRREDDRTTVWLKTHWRDPHADDEHLWFALCVARMALNDIDSMTQLGYPTPWEPAHFRKLVLERQTRGQRVYNPAYMIATPNWSGPKYEFLIQKLLTPLWAGRAKLRPAPNDTLASFYARLTTCYGVGSFTAAQVVADLKYTPQLASATDWWTWAAPGPGSRRGLNRVLDLDKDSPWRDDIWLNILQLLLKAVNKSFKHAPFHTQDLQNVMCEFDKYERARLGEGRPKQKYVPFVGVST